ncbi:MAG: MlaC/ttg2D family ABC transporter substrate-binding protein [Pseudomonadota bacterium]
MITRRAVLAAAAALLAAGLAGRPAAAAGDPVEFVRNLGNQAIQTLTGSDLSSSERAHRFRTLLLANFDVPAIGKTVLGRYWRTATPEERQEYLKLFEEFLVANYAQRFAQYAGEQFVVKSVRDDGDQKTVFTEIKRPSGELARLDWVLRAEDDSYKILDVKVEGISMSETHRSEFASVIQNSGGKISGLIDALRKKVDQLGAG